ncbi:putative RNA-directed DNA polymerase from transposon BS [Araneus ventricosus]|uniref:Putative RNA-directed DNA polymerase from transposon BS n=1 Tax=Araneus ventricosus TaxID=182803 RepID=A0A4Y2PJU7_ARAVE|nr:putative RNA-directed DNA polymerase from transposon BS [Araneus ventricosus]
MLKLLQSGVRGKIALWISYFFQDRKAFVSWRGVSSTLFKHERGVPQGSVLSPLIFTVFMHDVYSVLPNDVTCFIYADDIFILVEEYNIEAVKNKLRFCVSKLESWCNEWHMDIAPQKSNIINLSSRRSPTGFPVLFRGSSIPWSNDVRFLGIQFAATLSFRSHIEQLKTKAFKKLNVIKGLAAPRWGANASNLLKICNACITQSIEYGAHTVGVANKAGYAALQVIQNNILRFVFGLPRWTPLPVLYRNSNEINMKLRKNMVFFVNQFSAREFTAVWGSIKEVNSIISNRVFNRLPCGATLENYSRLGNQSLDQIILIRLPVSWDDCKHFVIRTNDLRVYSGTPGWVGRRHFFRPLTTSAILVPVFPTGWDLARSKKGFRFLGSSVPAVNSFR